MPTRTIVLYPDPVLVEPTRPVREVDDEVRTLVRDMVETMHAAPGIGLAANQVGVGLRVCVVDLSVGEDPDALKVLINPEIKAGSGREIGEEGCLSFPDITLDIERFQSVSVDALDLDGRPITVACDGLLARVFQHEIEHLDGHTFLQNLSSLKRELVKRQIKKRMKNGDWVAAVASR